MHRPAALALAVVIAALATALGTAPAAAQQTESRDSLAISRRYTEWFYHGNADSLYAHVAADAREQMSPDDMRKQLAMLTTRAGFEEKVLEEKFVKRNGKTQYWRTAKFSRMEEPLVIRWALNEKLELIGAGMNPRGQTPPVDPQ